MNEVIKTVLNRRSTRFYSDRKISDEEIQMILKAAMSGPSCTNARDWQFIVVTDKDRLNQMADANGRPAQPLKRCPLAVLILGDLEKAFPPAKDYWVIDGAIAGQNMVLTAESLGIGSVWLGTWPQMDRVEKQRELFGLPEHLIPHSIIAFGYPAKDGDPYGSGFPENSRPEWEPDKIHFY